MSKATQLEQLPITSHPARHFVRCEGHQVLCRLCPRNCTITPGQPGDCQVRFNEGGDLVTWDYGVSTPMTQKVIENDFIYHFLPGAPTLSLGSVASGTAENSFLVEEDRKSSRRYTPEQVVAMARRRNLPVLSWTIHQPVVWHEFVTDTARLAQKHGLLNLYRSTLFLSPEAIDDFRDCMDIFSITLPSLDPDCFSRITGCQLEPVLKAIKQIHRWGDRHIEIHHPKVAGPDQDKEVKHLVSWILEELDENVPLHLIGSQQARDHSLEMGLKHCYLGNGSERGEGSRTHCPHCRNLLVDRFGLQAQTLGLRPDGTCKRCRKGTGIIPYAAWKEDPPPPSHSEVTFLHAWSEDSPTCHVAAHNQADFPKVLEVGEKAIPLHPGEEWHMQVARQSEQEIGVVIKHAKEIDVTIDETPGGSPRLMAVPGSHGVDLTKSSQKI